MSNTVHTAGPWTFEESSTGGIDVVARKENARVSEVCYIGEQRSQIEEARANARLISAAPELLEAATAILNHMQPPGTVGAGYRTDRCGKYLQTLRAAIDKARS